MESAREYNYDWLRVVSMIAVIMIHVSVIWVSDFSTYVSEGGNVEELLYPMMSCVYNTISRFAVPCFVMLTGAFVLSDSRTANYKEFYSKKIIKIGVPTIIFSCLYILYRIPFCFIGEQAGMGRVFSLIKDIIKGSPFYHMWYLYMLVSLYFLAPIVIQFKDSIKYKNFRIIVFVFMLMGSLSGWTTGNVQLSWDIGQAFEYLGYFMVGYVIRKDLKKDSKKGIFLIVVGVLLEIATAFAEYQFQIVNGIGESELEYSIVGSFCPTIVVASLLVFAGFTMLSARYNVWIEKLSAMSFIIYLVHAGALDVICKLLNLVIGKNYIRTLNNVYWIPILVIMVLLFSILLTIIYRKIESYIMSNLKNRRVLKS